MKKLIIGIILVIILGLGINTIVYGANDVTVLEENTNEIFTLKDETQKKVAEYSEKYESDAYGWAAYILNIVRIYSIPVCFVGIVIGALNQYVLGTRRLDKKHKGYGIIMTFVTLLVICQVLPLIFTIVVIGWRG